MGEGAAEGRDDVSELEALRALRALDWTTRRAIWRLAGRETFCSTRGGRVLTRRFRVVAMMKAIKDEEERSMRRRGT